MDKNKVMLEIKRTEIEDVILLEPTVFGDERGYFLESFSLERWTSLFEKAPEFIQDNESMSQKGVLRGLHFQKEPHAQGKLVRVVKGAVVDVAVDIRLGSPTYGKHVTVKLTGENKKQAYIPPGFAHGFLTLEDETIFSYKCTNYYNKESEGGLMWNDPVLNIDWGLDDPILSEKDTAYAGFNEFKSSFHY
jgi:dTDP-4-dehydrorhamnose 3,5-epimerase